MPLAACLPAPKEWRTTHRTQQIASSNPGRNVGMGVNTSSLKLCPAFHFATHLALSLLTCQELPALRFTLHSSQEQLAASTAAAVSWCGPRTAASAACACSGASSWQRCSAAAPRRGPPPAPAARASPAQPRTLSATQGLWLGCLLWFNLTQGLEEAGPKQHEDPSSSAAATYRGNPHDAAASTLPAAPPPAQARSAHAYTRGTRVWIKG